MDLPNLGGKPFKKLHLCLSHVGIQFRCTDVLASVTRANCAHPFLAHSVLGEATLVACNWAWWECLHFRIGHLFLFLRANFPGTTAGKKKYIRDEPGDNMKVFLLIILEVVQRAFYRIQQTLKIPFSTKSKKFLL